MKKTVLILFTLGAGAFAAITVQPSGITAVYNQSSTKRISYQFDQIECSQVSSPEIRFYDALGSLLGRTASRANTTLDSKGKGSLSELVTVPSSILRAAAKNFDGGPDDFLTMRRDFTYACAYGSTTDTATVTIHTTTQAAAGFTLTRLQLAFPNNQIQTVVNRNDPLQVSARINFNGSGQLRGYWEVDGRPFPPIRKTLSGRNSVTVPFGPADSLPTFNPGKHRVRFVVTSPTVDFKLPVLTYLVNYEQNNKLLPVTLDFPKEEAAVFMRNARFKWSPSANAALYLVEFFSEAGKKPLTAAYVKQPKYTLSTKTLKTKFEAGQKCQWKVTGFDANGNPIAQSETRSFTLLFN